MGSAPAARVELLDGFALQLGTSQQETADVLPRGIQRLVAHLSLGCRSTRTLIAGQLWPNVPERHAKGSLRSALWRLQKIAPGLIRMHGETLSLAESVEVDVRELAGWARRVRDPESCLDELSSTDLRLGGELLPGWCDDWVLLERERLRQVRMHALEVLADRLAAVGRYGDAVQAAHAAVHVEPLRESAHRTLIRVHLAEGNTLEAVNAYEACRALLAEELGVIPSRQLSDLVSDLPLLRRPRHPVPHERAHRRSGTGVAAVPTGTSSTVSEPGQVWVMPAVITPGRPSGPGLESRGSTGACTSDHTRRTPSTRMTTGPTLLTQDV